MALKLTKKDMQVVDAIGHEILNNIFTKWVGRATATQLIVALVGVVAAVAKDGNLPNKTVLEIINWTQNNIKNVLENP